MPITEKQMKKGVPLPDQITGHEIICLTLPVPNDPAYIAAVEGAISSLWDWYTWQKEGKGTTRATEAAHYLLSIQSGNFRYSLCPDDCEECGCEEECEECGNDEECL